MSFHIYFGNHCAARYWVDGVQWTCLRETGWWWEAYLAAHFVALDGEQPHAAQEQDDRQHHHLGDDTRLKEPSATHHHLVDHLLVLLASVAAVRRDPPQGG